MRGVHFFATLRFLSFKCINIKIIVKTEKATLVTKRSFPVPILLKKAPIRCKKIAWPMSSILVDRQIM